MPHLRISECAELLAVSDDTVRRLIEAGTLPATTDAAGRRVVDGAALAGYMRARSGQQEGPHNSSARNRLTGLITRVHTDEVMAQVELQCGPYRLVSLMSSEAVRDLGLQVGTVATAVVKATTVIVETP